MKQLVVFSVMCLSTLFAKAQVMTSETVNNVYAALSTADKSEFAYNGECDDSGRMTAMTIYKKDVYSDKREYLVPAIQHRYEYTADGLLKSRISYVWHQDVWQCACRRDFNLNGSNYAITYSRWNKKHADFDPIAEQFVYILLPDNSIHQVSFYQREHNGDSLQLAWQVPVENIVNDAKLFLTQK